MDKKYLAKIIASDNEGLQMISACSAGAKVKVSNINKETHDSVSISFDIGTQHLKEFNFTPGQYIVIKANINGDDCRRSYSICSSKNEILTVAIKKVENG